MKTLFIILASVFMILGILYLAGKGDWLFSKKEKEIYFR